MIFSIILTMKTHVFENRGPNNTHLSATFLERALTPIPPNPLVAPPHFDLLSDADVYESLTDFFDGNESLLDAMLVKTGDPDASAGKHVPSCHTPPIDSPTVDLTAGTNIEPVQSRDTVSTAPQTGGGLTSFYQATGGGGAGARPERSRRPEKCKRSREEAWTGRLSVQEVKCPSENDVSWIIPSVGDARRRLCLLSDAILVQEEARAAKAPKLMLPESAVDDIMDAWEGMGYVSEYLPTEASGASITAHLQPDKDSVMRLLPAPGEGSVAEEPSVHSHDKRHPFAASLLRLAKDHLRAAKAALDVVSAEATMAASGTAKMTPTMTQSADQMTDSLNGVGGVMRSRYETVPTQETTQQVDRFLEYFQQSSQPIPMPGMISYPATPGHAPANMGAAPRTRPISAPAPKRTPAPRPRPFTAADGDLAGVLDETRPGWEKVEITPRMLAELRRLHAQKRPRFHGRFLRREHLRRLIDGDY